MTLQPHPVMNVQVKPLNHQEIVASGVSGVGRHGSIELAKKFI